MTDKEAADILYSVCEYLGLSAQMLKYRVLSGWVLMPPANMSLNPQWVNPHHTSTPSFSEASPELMLGETRTNLPTDQRGKVKP